MSTSTIQGRYARMLKIFQQLQSGGGLNASDLAVELDVCRRTIFRDLRTMRKAGLEVYFDEHLECYRLSPQEDLVTAPALSQEELTTLAAAVHLSVLRQLPDCHDVLRQSLSKLLAGSPRRVQHHVSRVIRSCCLHEVGDHEIAPSDHIVHHILTAISRRQLLRVRIIDPKDGEEVVTRFAPYQMIATVDTWQVVGRSSHHRGVRTFDPRYMRQPEITDEIYAIPRRFQG